MNEELRYIKTRKDGRVECVNIWSTGFQELIVPSKAAFDALKQKIEHEDYVPQITGYSK